MLQFAICCNNTTRRIHVGSTSTTSSFSPSSRNPGISHEIHQIAQTNTLSRIKSLFNGIITMGQVCKLFKKPDENWVSLTLSKNRCLVEFIDILKEIQIVSFKLVWHEVFSHYFVF